ncbi:MAG: hypothetical protein WC426_12905 [Sulfuriferula sp.]
MREHGFSETNVDGYFNPETSAGHVEVSAHRGAGQGATSLNGLFHSGAEQRRHVP